MSDHYKQGLYTQQAHKAIPEGYFEEEQGHLGFFGPVSHLIRKSPSTRWVEIDGALKPRMFDLMKMDPELTERTLLFNNQVSINWKQIPAFSKSDKVVERNSNADLLLFCHKGHGRILTEYGELNYKAGHYIVVPKSLMFFVWAEVASDFLTIENLNSHFNEPDRGIVGRHALYDREAIEKPQLDSQNKRLSDTGEVFLKVRVKHGSSITTFKYKESLFDVVGWKGDLYPYALHVDNIMPLMSHRAHLPPSAHTTFVARDFVVCTFLPRPLETDGDALKVPFYHQNIDYDEVIFYHDGDFFSRDNLHAGMMSWHPAGFPHGPHPKAMKNINNKTHTNEYAVMIDTRWPLHSSAHMEPIEFREYWKSWQS